MIHPWPRRFFICSALAASALVAALMTRAPRSVDGFSDLRDAVGDHRALLSAGHSALACASCHFAHPARAPQPLWQTQGGGDSSLFARESEQAGGSRTGLCMSCHDGAVAPSLQAHGGFPGGERFAALGPNPNASHPVGVDYMAAFRRDPGSYVDPAANPGIVLEEGKVGCMSCHAGHDVSAVSAGNVRQEVCIECHRR
ncbi:MAG: hypothetical protein HY403_10795 [Elusimicrobia bacterium]|nr:hypothetical protein [Elusimicrobiota bacterium]